VLNEGNRPYMAGLLRFLTFVCLPYFSLYQSRDLFYLTLVSEGHFYASVLGEHFTRVAPLGS